MNKFYPAGMAGFFYEFTFALYMPPPYMPKSLLCTHCQVDLMRVPLTFFQRTVGKIWFGDVKMNNYQCPKCKDTKLVWAEDFIEKTLSAQQ